MYSWTIKNKSLLSSPTGYDQQDCGGSGVDGGCW